MKIPCEKCILSTLNENTEFPWNGMWWGAHGKEYSVFLPKGRSFEKNRPFARQRDGKVMSLYKYAEMEELNNWLAWTLHLSLLINVTSYSWNGARVLECLWIRLNNRMNFLEEKKKKGFAKTYYIYATKGCLWATGRETITINWRNSFHRIINELQIAHMSETNSKTENCSKTEIKWDCDWDIGTNSLFILGKGESLSWVKD